MASENLYKKFTSVDVAKNQEGGYKNVVLFAPRSTFSSIKTPTATPAVLGDTKKITTAHTFKTDEGWISLLCRKHSVTTKTTTIGPDGAQSLQHESEFIILGDSAQHLEQFEKMINDDLLFLLKDQACSATEYVQFGDECSTPDVKLEATGNTTKEGLKEYKFTISVKGKKFFYSSTVTEKTVSNPNCPVVTITPASTNAAGSWPAVSGATKYKISIYDSAGTSLAGAPHEVTSGTSFSTIPTVTLTPGTDYMLKFEPFISGSYYSSCDLIPFTTTS